MELLQRLEIGSRLVVADGAHLIAGGEVCEKYFEDAAQTAVKLVLNKRQVGFPSGVLPGAAVQQFVVGVLPANT